MSWILNTVVFLASYILMKICSSPNIITVNKLRIRCAGRVARLGRSAFSILVGKLEERDQLEDQGIDERVVLNFISHNLRGRELE
jgi:hypothetical protein